MFPPKRDGRFRACVDGKLEDIRSRIVANDIKIVLSARDRPTVDFRDLDRLAGEIGFDEHIAKRIDNARPAPDQDGSRIIPLNGCDVDRTIAAREILTGRDDKAAPFERDGSHCRKPGVAVVNGGRTIEFDALRVHGRPEKRHIVLPADHAADPPDRCINHADGRAVAKAPDEPLQSGRHQLAMFVEQLAGRGVSEGGAVQRPAIAFDDTDDHVDAVVPRDLANPRRFRSGHINGAFEIASKVLAAFGTAQPEPGAKVQTLRIAADKSLWKDDEIGAIRCGVAGQLTELGQSLGGIEKNRSGLNDRGLDEGHDDLSDVKPPRACPVRAA